LENLSFGSAKGFPCYPFGVKPIINISELEFAPFPGEIPENAKKKFEGAKLGFAGQKIGAQKLGYSVIVVPAGKGKRAFPFHSHRVNEEAFFILEGEGEVRIGAESFPVKKGDFIAHPPGGPETAHQLINTSDKAELRYIGISTRESPEIAEYPDSGKFGVMGMFGLDRDGKPNIVRFLGRLKDSLGYWEGE
jgi:uncharacterized cupin superfamily protein